MKEIQNLINKSHTGHFELREEYGAVCIFTEPELLHLLSLVAEKQNNACSDQYRTQAEVNNVFNEDSQKNYQIQRDAILNTPLITDTLKEQ